MKLERKPNEIFSPISIGEILFDLITRGIDFSNSLTVVDKNSIRIRKY